MSMQAATVIVSRQGDAYEIVFENTKEQAAVRLPRNVLIHLARQISRVVKSG